jgi:hypothetical protein
MFASLLRPRKQDGPETTPLLQALSRYRPRDADARSPADDDAAHDDADEDDDYEDEDQGRDGPLLPVFSSTVLGTHTCKEPPCRRRGSFPNVC